MAMDEEILELFNEESVQNLTLYAQELPKLASDPGNAEAAKKLYQAAHTMSGISVSVGFDKFAEVSKPIETALRPVRDDGKAADPTLIQILADGYEAMRLYAAEAAKEDPQVPQIWDDLVSRLAAYNGQ